MLNVRFTNARQRVMTLVSLFFLTISVSADDLGWTFKFSPSDIVLSPRGNYSVVALTDGANPRDVLGAPAMPAKYANILLPDGATDVTVTATGDLVPLASDVMPWPVQRVAPKSKPQPPFTAPDRVAYASVNPWPAAVATFEGLHEMQGSTFVSVRVNPVVYVGSERALYYRPSVKVTVSYTLPAAARGGVQSTTATDMVNALVVNPTATTVAHRGISKGKPVVDYLIITSSNLLPAFQKYAKYRSTALGGSFKTRVVTTESIYSDYSGVDNQEKIRNCIIDYYENHGTAYVLLGGDDSVVPDRDTYAKVDDDVEKRMPTDLYYSDLTSTWKAAGKVNYGTLAANVDMSFEVIVGRIPIRTAEQLTGYLAKVRAFESSLSVPRNSIILGGPAAWCRYHKNKRPKDDVTGDGHVGFRAPNHDYVSDSEMWLRRLYRDGISPYWNNVESASNRTVNMACDAITSWDTATTGDEELSATNLKTWLNNGYTHLMFSGHGYPQGWGMEGYANYTVKQAKAQTGITAFIFTDACLTGAFDEDGYGSYGITLDPGTYYSYTYDSEPCLGEAYLRNPNGGALAYMGCARYGWGEPDADGSSYATDEDGYYIGFKATDTSDGGPSTVYAYKFYKRLYESEAIATNRTVGQAFAMSKADMISQCGTYGCERWIQFGLNYLGDPAIVLYPRISNSAIKASLASINFKETFAEDLSKTETIRVRAKNLMDDITVSLEDESGAFTVSSTTIAKAEAEAGTAITLTWTPTEVGETTATLTLSSARAADVVITITAKAENPNATPGTAERPYTVAEACAAIKAGSAAQNVYVEGIVSKIVTPYDGRTGTITYEIADISNPRARLRVYLGLSYNGERFTSADDLQVGDKVVVLGNLVLRNEKIYAVKPNSQLVSLVRGKQDIAKTSTDGNGIFNNQTTGIAGSLFDTRDYQPAWYTMNGLRLSGKPTKPGVYLCNGNKVVIK